MGRMLNQSVCLGVIALLCGCATTGDGLSDEALSGNPDAMWADGQKLNGRGETMIKRGEARLESGRRKVREGEELIQRGSTEVSSARFAYQNAVQAGGTAVTPKAVAQEANNLKAIGQRWEDAIEMIRDGNRQVNDGNKILDAGHLQIREGRTLMERGSILMRNSERMRRGDELLEPSSALSQR